jgi:hypothetical protein
MRGCITYVQVLGFLSRAYVAMTGDDGSAGFVAAGGLGSRIERSPSPAAPVRSDGGVAPDGFVRPVARVPYREQANGTEHVNMTNPALRILPLVLAFGLSACAGQNEPQPITAEPVLDKFGNVELCVGSDGRTYPPRPELLTPCTPIDECPDPVQVPGSNLLVCEPPDDCPDGFFSTATGEFICPAPDRNTSGDSTSGGRPSGGSGNDPAGTATRP